MQTDLQLLLLLIGFVLGGYIFFKACLKRTTKASLATRNALNASYSSIETDGSHEIDNVIETEKLKKDEGISSMSNDVTNEMKSNLNPNPKKETQEIIAFSVISKHPSGFPGHLLLSTLKANQFYFGKRKIFHRHENDNPMQPILFSLASLYEPGVFDWHQMENGFFPGVLIWAQFKGGNQDTEVFEKLLISARQLAASLNGTLCDGERHPVTVQTIAQYRMRIKECQEEN